MKYRRQPQFADEAPENILTPETMGVVPGDIDPMSLTPECRTRLAAITAKMAGGYLPTAEEMQWLANLSTNASCIATGIKPPTTPTPTTPTTPGTPTAPSAPAVPSASGDDGLAWWVWALIGVGGLWLVSKL